ncbi:unnamed protein product [Adineta steineri]|uniref:Ubiquitin carboxyl-terminal hydrolase n=2 Tax=Adineta steineri TaxID=433720 RepID=A0A815E6B6_9BILA|nr:unnamed protein product [Adineta steineri]CAF1577791.1 unnamed protein product [Adineta steineri]
MYRSLPANPLTNRNIPFRGQNREDQRIQLRLRYNDRRYGIELYTDIETSSTITVSGITKDLLEFLCLDDIPPEVVSLVGVGLNGRYYVLKVTEKRRSLRDVGVTDGCTLYFEPENNAPPPKQCQLTVVSPDETDKIDFKWYTAKTTLAILLEYIIEQFSLQSISRDRIHLLTIAEELDISSDGKKRLSELNIHDRMSIYVQIIPPLVKTSTKEDTDVHVQCIYNGDKFIVNVPNTTTINGLKDKIQMECKDRTIIDFKLSNETKEELDLNDFYRVLKSFGIKRGQTVYATFRATTRKTQSLINNTQNSISTDSSLSSTPKTKHDRVMVICKFPTDNPVTFQISVRDTIIQLIREIKSRIPNKRLVLSEINSNDIHINLENDTFRCLADLGIKPNDKINAIMIDKSPIYSSIVSKQTTMSLKPDKQIKSQSTSRIPIGLTNLGNSCYMNSALQCLAHIPPLTNFFLESMDRTHMRDNEDENNDWNPYDAVGDVTGAYAELLWNLRKRDENNPDMYTFTPNRIKDNMGKKDSRFASSDQQDAQEFMTFLLDIIHQELKTKNKNDRNTIIKKLFFGEITSTVTCTACHKEDSTINPISSLSIPLNRQERRFWITFITKQGKDELTLVDVPIDGQVGHLVEAFAQKHNEPLLFYYVLVMLPDGEVDLNTPLSQITGDELIFMEQEERCDNIRPKPLEKPKTASTLDNCLEEFFSKEYLEDEWRCQQENCKKKVIPMKQLKLRTLPSILIIQFKRFSHENGLHQKIETFVDYPLEGLDLKRFLPSSSSSSSDDAIYDLIAVCNHMGSIFGGHYVAYAQDLSSSKNKWFKFDDSSVTSVKSSEYADEIISRDAYLLFYIRRDILYPITSL